MSDTTHEVGESGAVDGLALEKAVERTLADRDDLDADRVRTVLAAVAEDGVVSHASVDESVQSTSKLLATAETRAELARIALEDARETADPVADCPTVAARLDRFESVVAGVEADAADLGPALDSVLDDFESATGLFAVAEGIERLEADARAAQRTADEVQLDLEEFERWLDDHALRVRQYADELDAFASALDDLEAVVDETAAVDSGDGGGAAVDTGDETARDTELARTWFDATLRHRAMELTVADLRSELADLRTLAERPDADPADSDSGLDDLERRVDDLDARREALGERLDAVARAEWSDRFGDPVAAVEREFDELAPPIDWSVVQETLRRRRADF